MKKILAVALVCVMAAALAAPMSAGTKAESVEALYFNELPTIDGVVTEEEWGEVTVSVTPDSPSYYISDTAAPIDPKDADNSMDVWFRWTEDYFYFAAICVDTNGHSLPAGDASLWSGDVIQFRYDFTPVEFGGDASTTWSTNACNAAIGLLTDGKVQAYDFVNSTDIAGVQAKVVYDAAAKQTTYEYAIPYSALAEAKGEAGVKVGIALTRLNASEGTAYEGWFSWGDGICGPQDDSTRVGANTVTLSDEDAIIPMEEEVSAAEAPASSAATSDAGIVMFAALALISLAGVAVAKKVR